MKFNLLVISVCALFAYSCGIDDGDVPVCDPVPVADQNDIIDDYIAQNALDMQTTASGLRYSIDVPGTGDNVMYGDTVELDYIGTLLTGGTFDQGTLGPPSFPTFEPNSFIPGFEEGLLLFNDGAQGTIILPGALAYGCFPPVGSPIGDNEILIFQITIVSINP